MFDLAWSEIALIGVVALVVIGPKDLPEAIRGVARGIQKLRRMASEFQSHADELVREAKLDEVRNQINEVRSAVHDIRNFDLRTEVERHVDSDGSIRRTFQDDPLRPDWANPPPVVTTPPPPEGAGAAVADGGAPAASPQAAGPPAFIPPDAVAAAAAFRPPPPATEPAPDPSAPAPPPRPLAAAEPAAAAAATQSKA
jgi:sec-independent protein translocase protein TatB